jgi:molybdopterin converting factor small subunit
VPISDHDAATARVQLRIPESLVEFADNVPEIGLEASDVQQALLQLQKAYPKLYRGVCDETGAVRKHLNIFVNSDLIAAHAPGGLRARLAPGDVLTIWTAVSGG